MKKASTLVEAIHRFSPQPIVFGRDSTNESFYVERTDEPLGELRVHLMSAPTGTDKTLLAGHRGTGKSTELNRLAADPEVQAHYEVVSFSVKDSLELTDVDHVDLLFTMVARTYEALSSDGAPLELKPETVQALEGWRSRVVERMEEVSKGAAADLSAGNGGLSGFFGKFGVRLRYERTTREVARQVIQPRIGEFIGHLSDFFVEVQLALKAHKGKRLLLLIEDLDKLSDIRMAEALFFDTGPYLVQPPVRIVYTVPIALHYSKKFAQIANRFGESVLVPNVRLVSHETGGEPYQEGLDTMHAFVKQRMDASLIEDDAMEQAVQLGGGLFQQTQRLMQKACTKAVGRKMSMLSAAEVRDAASDLRAELERGLKSDDIRILHEVHETRQTSADEASLQLLHYLHLVEYRNSERWCDVNPLLLPTLERWKPETAR